MGKIESEGVNDSLNPRLDSLRENELQVRIMGEDEDLDVGEEIFAEAEKRGEFGEE